MAATGISTQQVRTAAAANIGTANAEGTSTALARADHGHLVNQGYTAIAQAAAIAPDATTGSGFFVNMGTNASMTVNVPTGSSQGRRILINIINSSGGALGTITWASGYHLQTTWSSPSNGGGRFIEFIDAGSNIFRELFRSVGDIA